MSYEANKPLMVQKDGTILVESAHEQFEALRGMLVQFADLLKSPGGLHTYRITALSIWNAIAAGLDIADMISFLKNNAKFPVPTQAIKLMEGWAQRYGQLMLLEEDGQLLLHSKDPSLLDELGNQPEIKRLWGERLNDQRVIIQPELRGLLKQALIRNGYPVADQAGYHQGETVNFHLDETILRHYQRQAIDSFYVEGQPDHGSGVIVMPCGAGKTLVGIAAIARLQCATLILAPNVTAVRQWQSEIARFTKAGLHQIGEYSGAAKEVKPITIATYQILTHRRSEDEPFKHMQLFHERNWGLIIYDEVHLLPAPVFRVTADIAATRKLGLTATLIREDGLAQDVFSLIGPKRFDIPWKKLESETWIATAICHEVRVEMKQEAMRQYLDADSKQRGRMAGENPNKLEVVVSLLRQHADKQVLVIGQYLSQLRAIAARIQAPMISGSMPHHERDRLYAAFREGKFQVLVVSKVANFAVDLPDAAVAIQVSGSFGSRQEEAQRLGRILRPKQHGQPAYFYTLVSSETKECEYAAKRQMFLIEQGYQYEVSAWEGNGKEIGDEKVGFAHASVDL